MNQLGLRNCRQVTQRSQDGFAYVAVYSDDGNGFGTGMGFAAAKRKGGDVDAMLAKCCADMADYAGFVVVAQIKHGTVQGCFHGDAVNLDQSRRAVEQYSTLGAEPGSAGFVW